MEANSTSPSVQHADVVVDAARQTVLATCGVEPRASESDEGNPTDKMILAIISLVGDVEWSVFLGLPEGTATQMCERFAGFPIPFESDDMGDAIGELCNILVGQVKAMLDQRSVAVDISLPSVMRAVGLQIFVQRDRLAQRVRYDSPLGMFWTGIIAGNSM